MAHTRHTTLNRVLAGLGAGLLVATGVLFAAYGGASGDASAKPATAVAVDHVDIKDFMFAPAAITVAVGTTITWSNSDTAPHTATSGAAPSPDGVFDTGILKQGQRKKIKVTKAGIFDYYCELHAFMKATVTVR